MILEAKKGDKGAYEYLANICFRFYDLVIAQAGQSLCYDDYCSDDYLYEFSISLNKTIEIYEPGKGKFISLFIEVFRKRARIEMKKNKMSTDALNNYISLDSKVREDICLIDCIKDENILTPSEEYSINEYKYVIERQYDKRLPRKATELRLKGHTYAQISKTLKVSISRVRRVLKEAGSKSLEDINIKFK